MRAVTTQVAICLVYLYISGVPFPGPRLETSESSKRDQAQKVDFWHICFAWSASGAWGGLGSLFGMPFEVLSGPSFRLLDNA